MKLVNH